MRWKHISATAILGLCLVLGQQTRADKADDKAWEIRSSDPGREGRFLNVPIYYGDWIPIYDAKSIVENVASKIEQVQQQQVLDRQDHQVQVSPEIDRVDVQVAPEVEASPTVVRRPNLRRRPVGWRQPPVPTSNKNSNNNNRRPFRRQDNYRRRRKLPVATSFVNQITSFFGGGQPQQPQHRAPPPPPPHPQSPVDNVPSESFGIGNVFGLPSFFVPPRTQPVVKHDPHQTPFGQPNPSVPILKQIPAPDLTHQSGPPVFELDAAQDQGEGEIIFGQKVNDDHLSGFVPVSYEHVTSGEQVASAPRHPHQNQPKDFAVVLSGVHDNTDARELAELLKEGKMNDEQHQAFIAPEAEAVPAGFQKVKLPFMEHSDDVSQLPSVFIAPVGFQVPEGYKGHPLPYDPVGPKVTVVHTTDTTQSPLAETTPIEDNSVKNSVNLIRDKLKLARNRPSLADFYKNKAKQQDEQEIANKKRRILTKIVRRPFKPKTPLKSYGLFNNEEDVEEEHVEEEEVLVEEQEEEEEEVNRENPFTTARPVTWVDVDVTTLPSNSDVSEESLTTEVSTLQAIESEVVEQTVAPVSSEDELVTEIIVSKSEFFEPTTVRTDAAPTVSVNHGSFTEDLVSSDAQGEQVDEELVSEAFATYGPSTTAYTTTASTTTTSESTTTSTTTTTEATTSEEVVFATSPPYEPTPFNNLRPLRRLELLKYKSPLHRLRPTPPAFVPTTAPVTTTTEEPEVITTSRYDRVKIKKFGTDNRFYGQRIRSRKRPSFWSNGYGYGHDEEVEETTTSTTVTTPGYKGAKTEEYKKKFRPFFDELYDKLTKGSAASEPKQRPVRRFYGKRRSTTTPNPYTIDAEIYEVHPQSGQRVVTKTTTVSPDNFFEYEEATTTEVPFLPEYPDYDHGEQEAKAQDHHELTSLPPLEYQEYTIAETTPKYEVSAHSTVSEEQGQGYVLPTVEATLPTLDPNVPYVYPEAPLNYDYVHNDLVDTDNAHLDFAESQQVENTWNHVQFVPPDGDPSKTPSSAGRLDHYQKPEIAPSADLAQQHETEYDQPHDPVVNEHSQQHLLAEEGGFVPFLDATQNENRPSLSYVTLNRRPLTTTTEPDIIYFDDVKEEQDSFSVPVDASFGVPSTDASVTTTDAQVTTTEVSAQSEEVGSTTIAQESAEVTETKTPVREFLEVETAIDVDAPTEKEIVQDHPGVTTPVEDLTVADATTAVPDTTSLNKEIYVEDTLTSTDTTLTESETKAITETASTTSEIPTTTDHQEDETTSSGGFLSNLLNYLLPTTPTPQPEAFATTEIEYDSTTTTHHNNLSETTTESINELIPTNDETTVPTTAYETTFEAETAETTTDESTTELIEQPEVDEDEEVRESQAQPKAVDTNQILVPSLNKPSWLEKEEEASPVSQLSPEKLNFVVKKREQLIKNWVSRKYKQQKTTTTPDSVQDTTTFDEDIQAPTTAEPDVNEDNNDVSGLLPFAPTVLPKKKLIAKRRKKKVVESNVKAILNDRKQQLLDKYSNARKSQLKDIFPKPTNVLIKSEEALEEELEKEEEKEVEKIPRGSNPDIFRDWEGDSLSQAEFERKVLGVSTATEVSVKSMICVRGRCFNADDMSGLIN